MLPRAVIERIATAVVRRLQRSRPKLLRNLADLSPAVVHISPTDLPYRFSLTLGCNPVRFAVIDRSPGPADAEVIGDVATLIDLLEGRTDSDSLFFRRDVIISGDTAVVVGLRNVLDREEIYLAAELGALCGPLRPQARAIAEALDRALNRVGSRVAALHRTLHPPGVADRDVTAEMERCRSDIGALNARLAALEARQKRRDEKIA